MRVSLSCVSTACTPVHFTLGKSNHQRVISSSNKREKKRKWSAVCECADLPVSGTSVGLMMRLICSIDCRSGERPVGDTSTHISAAKTCFEPFTSHPISKPEIPEAHESRGLYLSFWVSDVRRAQCSVLTHSLHKAPRTK